MTRARRKRTPKATLPARRRPRRARPDWGRRAIAACDPHLSTHLRRMALLWAGYGGVDDQTIVDRIVRTGWPIVAECLRACVSTVHSQAGLLGRGYASPRVEAVAHLVQVSAYMVTPDDDRARRVELLDSIESSIAAEPPKVCHAEAHVTACIGNLDPATANIASALCAFNWIANEGIWGAMDLYAKGIALRTFRDHGRRCGRELLRGGFKWLSAKAVGPLFGAWLAQGFSSDDARLVIARARDRLNLVTCGEGSK